MSRTPDYAKGWEICPVCSDCPDLVSYWTCDVCGNRAEKAGMQRIYRVGKRGEPSGFVYVRDGTFVPDEEA